MVTGSHVPVTATGAVLTRGGNLASVLLTAGADAATLTLHDNASAATGTVLCIIKAAANTSFEYNPMAYPFANGVYATLAGTSPTATVVYY